MKKSARNVKNKSNMNKMSNAEREGKKQCKFIKKNGERCKKPALIFQGCAVHYLLIERGKTLPAISFSVEIILEPLLKKEKVSTIRAGGTNGVLVQNQLQKGIFWKKPTYNVGDICVLFWKQRGKNKVFCCQCGNGDPIEQFPNDGCMDCGAGVEHRFQKYLGKVVITEVKRLIMGKDEKEGFYLTTLEDNKTHYLNKQDHYLWIVARRDGFDNKPEWMFKYFDDQYDLSTPKPYYRYKWRWI